MKKKVILLIFSILCTFVLFGCMNTEISEDSLKIEEEEVQKQDVMDEEKENHIEKETPKGGEAWGKDVEEFKGIISDSHSPSYGNLEINIKGKELADQLSLLCINDKTGAIYYVNFGQDNYIYQLERDKSTLLIEEEADFIQFWDNEIYFLKGKSSYPDILLNAYKLYKYSLDTKEISLVMEEEMIDFCISSEGIYYRTPVLVAERIEIRHLCKYFEKDTIEEVERFSYIRYKDYQLALDLKTNEMVMDIFLKDIHTNDNLHMASGISIFSMFSIDKNKLFFTNKNEIYCIDLGNGKKFSLFLDTYLEEYKKERPELKDEESSETFDVFSYTVINDKLYIVGNQIGMGIVSVDINTQEVKRFEVLNTGKSPSSSELEYSSRYPRLKELFAPYQLFTSGNRLFALSSLVDAKDPSVYQYVLIEIVINKDGYYVVRLGLD